MDTYDYKTYYRKQREGLLEWKVWMRHYAFFIALFGAIVSLTLASYLYQFGLTIQGI